MKRKAMAAIAAALIAVSPVLVPDAAAADTAGKPDASLELSGGTVAIGVGIDWAEGTLSYQGRQVPLKVKGLSVARVGAGKISASGKVYHLANPADIAGTYAAVSAGVALAGGGSMTALRNEKGVVIELRSTTVGVDLELGVRGLEVSLAKAS